MSKIVHVMVDLENLGTGPDAMVLSIGACTFGLERRIPEQTFYREINPETATGIIDVSTAKFWMEQASKGVMPPMLGAYAQVTAVLNFMDWLKIVGAYDNLVVWANGTDFDIPKLDRLFKEIKVPTSSVWKYNAVRDCRTIYKLFGNYGIKPERNNYHNALADAVWQAEYLISIVKNVSEFVQITEFEDAYFGNVSRGVLSSAVGDATSSGTTGETGESSAS